MIKVGQFTFSEIESKNHWVDFARFGAAGEFSVNVYDSIDEVPQLLDPKKAYQLSLDQSTKNTGIFIKDYKNTEAYMIEFSKQKGDSPDDYIFNLELFIHRLCAGCIFTHLIYERPIKSKNFRSSSVLFQLEGMIRALHKRYDEFKTAKLEYIENSSWFSVVIVDEYKKLANRKEASELSVKAIFDWTSLYGWSIGEDRDIFDAIGVMFGWFINSYDALGRPYVRGDRFNGNIGGFILPAVSAEEVAQEFKNNGIESIWCIENPRKPIYENIACAIEKYKVVCVELTDPYAMLAMSVECNLEWTNPDKMTLVVVAANYVDSKLFDITGKEYHFVL